MARPRRATVGRGDGPVGSADSISESSDDERSDEGLMTEDIEDCLNVVLESTNKVLVNLLASREFYHNSTSTTGS
jgi:hypothetical protein